MNKKWAYILALILAVTLPFSAFAEGNKLVTTRATQSILAEGNWAKVRVASSGMYLLSNSALSQMGFSDPSKVAVFGNGGAQLSFSNNVYRIDDLHQLPVLRTDKGLLFYAEGVVTWTPNDNRFSAGVNSYSAYSYYFITDSSTPGVTPSAAPSSVVADGATATSSSCNRHAHHENNAVNLQMSGRDWFGEELKKSKPSVSFDLDLPRRSSADDVIYLDFRLISKSSSEVTYSVNFNDDEVASGSISANGTSDYARSITRSVNFKNTNTTSSKVTITMSLASANDYGWVDYVTANVTAPLDMANASQMLFSTVAQGDFSDVTSYTIANAPSSLHVWDVTSPTEPFSVSANASSFVSGTDDAHSFVAFSTTGSFSEPSFVEKVNNQNLHSHQGVNYIIITCDDFLSEAQRLADAHRQYSGLSVAVVTCNQIYNEFSSGKRDVAALRDYIKMVRDRGLKGIGDDLRCVLLFGQGSYNNLLDSDNNRIPTYQSSNTLSSTQTYVTDDFFGWLDDKEGSSDTSARLDAGIGRFPCSNVEQARSLVNKSITYLTALDAGSWKANIAFAADDGDENEHLINAEKLASRVESLYPDMTIKRIFLETYKATQTSIGILYSQAHEDFMNAFNNGSAVVDYVGHAGPTGFTGDGLFKSNNIAEFTNKTRLPLLITAACEFCPFDHNIHSGGEEGTIYSNGGFIGVLGSTRIVYSSSNYKLNNNIYTYLFEADEMGRDYTIGEAIAKGKVASGGLVNSLKYVYLGDPAIVLPRQRLYANVDKVNGQLKELCDTPLEALHKSSIEGSIRSIDGNVDSTFNGNVDFIIYDKLSTTKTNGSKSSIYTFEEYKSPVYKGSAEVHDGLFILEFVLSKDINFEVDYGRIFLYATEEQGSAEAYGSYNQLLVGGFANDAADDTQGPVINAWIDYKEFHNGQLAGSNPVLYATIEDPSGINTSGFGAGHDLCIYINGDRNNAICLNSFFTYDAGSYTRGTLTYKLTGVTNGLQCLTIKAWDNLNNSSSLDLNVKVVSGSDISFGQTELYPNPLANTLQSLKLRFSHNDGGTTLRLTVRIYSVDGRLMTAKSFDAVSTATMTDIIDLTAEMPEISGLPRGLYLVKINVDSSSGRHGSFTKRLSIE